MFAIHQEVITHRLAQIDGAVNTSEAIGEIAILHGGDFSRLPYPYQKRLQLHETTPGTFRFFVAVNRQFGGLSTNS